MVEEMLTTIDWAGARNLILLDPAVAYFNTSSFGPVPRSVFDRITALRRDLSAEPANFMLRSIPDLLWQARIRLARFVGADPRRLILTVNVTAAINLIASSLSFPPQSEILLTNHEYGTMQWCWERAAKQLGLTIRILPLPTMASDPGEIVEAAVKAMSPNTRLFFFSHILSTTGLILPARKLCVEARSRGILTVIDGAHAPGFLDLDLAEIPCDFYAGSGHKWLLAPSGTGFLYFSSGNEDRLKPMQVSWGYHPPPDKRLMDERDQFGSTPRLRQFECEGTRDLCPWLVLPEAIDFQAMVGYDQIRKRSRELSVYLRERFVSCLGLSAATPEQQAMCGAMTAFCLPEDANVAVIRSHLWEKFRVEVSLIERSDQKMVRVSTHFFNTSTEIDRLVNGLGDLLQRQRSSTHGFD